MTTDTTPMDAARFDRDSWLVAAAAAGYLMVSVILMLLSTGTPSDGWYYEHLDDNRGMLAMESISGFGSPLLPGDEVVAVDGQPLTPLMAAFRPAMASTVWQTGGSATYTIRRAGQTLEFPVPVVPGSLHQLWRGLFYDANSWILNIGQFLSLLLVLFIFVRRPRNLGARCLLLIFTMWVGIRITDFAYNALAEYFLPPRHFYVVKFWALGWGWWLMPPLILFVLGFPLRKWLLRHHARPVTMLLYAVPTVSTILTLVAGNDQIFFVMLAAMMVSFVAAAFISTIHTLRTNRDPVVRAQLGWIMLGLFAPVGLAMILFQIEQWFPESGLGQLPPLGDALVELIFPICAAVAILGYRLFDLDLIINRALVYVTLTAGVGGVYVLVVSGLGAWLRMPDSLLLSVLATTLVAIFFAPVRDWVQRGVNRLLYGERDEPYRLLTQLGRQLAITQEPTTALAQTVEAVAKALKLRYVAITRQQEGSQQRIAAYGDAQAAVNRYPLLYSGQPIGELEVAGRQAHELLTAADERLLRDLARQLGVAVHAAQLTADLRQSRTRLVTTREEERRRLRRDLHDGLGPQLASQTLTLDVIAKLLHSDPEQAATLLLAVRQQLQQAVSDIRDLIYGLRPPVLDDLGLYGAIEEFVERIGQPGKAQINLQLVATRIALPAAVEVAAYRIVQEAVTNALKHAQASQITVTSRLEHAPHAPCSLSITICDNGIGLPADHSVGIGLLSMRERAEELGGSCVFGKGHEGGTEVVARLPIECVDCEETTNDHLHHDR